jgi:hypothetical protein
MTLSPAITQADPRMNMKPNPKRSIPPRILIKLPEKDEEWVKDIFDGPASILIVSGPSNHWKG